MKRILAVFFVCAFLLGVTHSVFAGATAEEAKALVEKPEAYLLSNEIQPARVIPIEDGAFKDF